MFRLRCLHFPGIVLVCLLASAAATAADAQYSGRPVVEVLLELRDSGLDFIFSSELVPGTLNVLSEPSSQNRLLIAREILAEHGLALSAIRPGLYAVVPAKSRSEGQTVQRPNPVSD